MTVDEEADEPEAATQIAIPPALEAAMQDTHEKWLVSKGRFDFGPFNMKAIVDQILHGQIHHGHVLMDKDEGGRAKVDEHPLLGPLVDAAKQARDDARRAHAEVKQQASERKRGVALRIGNLVDHRDLRQRVPQAVHQLLDGRAGPPGQSRTGAAGRGRRRGSRRAAPGGLPADSSARRGRSARAARCARSRAARAYRTGRARRARRARKRARN